MNDTIGTVRLLDVGPRPRSWHIDAPLPETVRRTALPSVKVIELIERAADVLTVIAVVVLTFPSLGLMGVHFDLTGAQSGLSENRSALVAVLLIASVYAVCLQSVGTYSLSGGLLRVRETACLLRAVIIGSCLLELYLFLAQGASDALALAACTLVLFGALILQKYLLATYFSHFEVAVSSKRRVLLYGDLSRSKHLQKAIDRSARMRMRIVASVDASRSSSVESSDDGVGALSLSILQRHHIETIVVAQPQPSEYVASTLRGLALDAGIPIYFLADFAEGSHSPMDCRELDGHFLFGLQTAGGLRGWHAGTKRTFDVVASVFLLLLTAIPLVIAGLLVKLTSSGPIFFRQVRIGEHGTPFTIFKFRTMHQEACGDSVSPSTSADPRITRVGRFLRKTSIDELPQLLNVLRGEMTMVGPRPEMPFIVANYKEIHRARLSVKPGLTGLWQISEHRTRPIHENIEYDLYYLRYRSLSFDLAILLHTLVFAVRGV